jgi:hypothetical protein
MATVGCVSIQQPFLQPKCRTTSKATPGFSCRATLPLQEQIGCRSSFPMQAAVSYGGQATAAMLQARRIQVTGRGVMGPKSLRRSRTYCLMNKCPGGVMAPSETRQDVGSLASTAEFLSTEAESLECRQGGEECVAGSGALAESGNTQLRYELDSLVHGHVGRFAFVGILLLGVGVACLASVGNADAATTTSMNSLEDGGLDVDMRYLAMGPEGPLLEEFWDNMRRYGLYFLTVVTGGVYQLVKPAVDAFKNPLTAVLVIVIVTGSIYLVGLTVSAMLGINEYHYEYAS